MSTDIDERDAYVQDDFHNPPCADFVECQSYLQHVYAFTDQVCDAVATCMVSSIHATQKPSNECCFDFDPATTAASEPTTTATDQGGTETETETASQTQSEALSSSPVVSFVVKALSSSPVVSFVVKNRIQPQQQSRSYCYSVRPLFASEWDTLMRLHNRFPSPSPSHRDANSAQTARSRSASVVQLFLVLPRHQQALECSYAFQHVTHNRFEAGVLVFILMNASSSSCLAAPDYYYSDDEYYVRDCTLRNSVIHLDPTIRIDQSHIMSCYIGPHVHIESSRFSSSSSSSSFCCQEEEEKHENESRPSAVLNISVGAETNGGRHLRVRPTSTLPEIARQLTHPKAPEEEAENDKDTREESPSTTTRSTSGINPPETTLRKLRLRLVNYLCAHNTLSCTPALHRVLLYPHASMVGAAKIENVTLFPHAHIGTGCIVTHCFLQWHGRIHDVSCVSNTLLMEHGVVGPQSHIHQTILGPDVHVANGEIHASLIGPQTNAHHQSVVIGVLWLCGRGNVGYGANVGSNHTGRCPDQEAVLGEGVFWGLSVTIKFPLYVAPYTIVAAGTTLAPQRMTFPFSLIVPNSSSHDPSGLNSNTTAQLLPGWVLGQSPYTLARAQIKIATRRKAQRHDTGWTMFRPSLVESMVVARNALVDAAANHHYPTMENNHTLLEGVGQCHMTEKARRAGCRAYTNAIQRYLLKGLLQAVCDCLDNAKRATGQDEDEFLSLPEALVALIMPRSTTTTTSTCSPPPFTDMESNPASQSKEGVPWDVLPWEEDSSHLIWCYQQHRIHSEFIMNSTTAAADIKNTPPSEMVELLVSLLEILITLETEYNGLVYDSKRRDDVRGVNILPGYAASHVPADQDPVIVHVRTETQATIQQARSIIERLGLLLSHR